MPELPEVETTKRGIEKALINQTISTVWHSGKSLRYPIDSGFFDIKGQKIIDISRRAKYLILSLTGGQHVIYHLGMSGMMRLCPQPYTPKKHDHVLLSVSSGQTLVFHDPRRFGCVLWLIGDVTVHPLMKNLGPEPFDTKFSAQYMKDKALTKKTVVKSFVMNNDVVVGVGNIYASEALFKAGIHPHRQAGRISLERFKKLHDAVVDVLKDAINAGGTTLKDFHNSEGKPGYFQQKLMVYGRTGQECFICGSLIKKVITGQRSTFYCPQCQK